MPAAQHKIMSAQEQLFDNFIVFIGGLLLSLTHPYYFAVDFSLSSIGAFIFRSLLGGALALIGKISVEWCIRRYKSRKKSNDQ